jgi:hypothetical protein
MGWTYLAADRDKWQSLVNAVMNIWVGSVNRRKFYDYLRNYKLFKNVSAPSILLVTPTLPYAFNP